MEGHSRVVSQLLICVPTLPCLFSWGGHAELPETQGPAAALQSQGHTFPGPLPGNGQMPQGSRDANAGVLSEQGAPLDAGLGLLC